MEQKQLWDLIWENGGKGSVNSFARRSFLKIKNKPFKTLLDLGCGIGVDSLYFAQKGIDVTAVDFSDSGIKHLNKVIEKNNIKNIHTIQKDIQNLGFPPNSFDVIYTYLSLHYFNDKSTSRIFDDLFEILKVHGLFFIKCKAIDDPLYGQGEKVEENMYIRDGHVRHFFSEQYMKEKLHKFDIVKIRKTSSTHHGYKSSFIEAVATKRKESMLGP